MRTINSIRNISFSVAGQIISLLLNFVNRTVIIYMLGMEYLGVIGIITNIITVLTLANMGISSALVFSLYKPLAEKNEEMILALLNFYKKVYRIIALFILIVGFLITPFIPYIMKESVTIPNLYIIYLLFVMDTSFSYFMLYKSSMFLADQKAYINSIITNCTLVISLVFQILILVFTKNYLLALIVKLVFTVSKNIYLSYSVDKRYPFIKDTREVHLNKEQKEEFKKNIFSLSIYNIASVVANGTDYLIISKFLGIISVGLYSNYMMIFLAIKNIVSPIFESFISSIGNLNVTETIEKKYEVFKIINFLNYWIYGFCAICFGILVNPLITIWLGSGFLVDKYTIILMAIYMYVGGMQSAASSFKSASGLYWQGRFGPVADVIINLGVSIILVQFIGMPGVVLGTLLSRIFTYTWIDPYVAFKYIFNKSIIIYFKKYALYSLATAVSAQITYMCSQTTDLFLLKIIICFTIPNVLTILFFGRTNEFQQLIERIKNLAIKLRFIPN